MNSFEGVLMNMKFSTLLSLLGLLLVVWACDTTKLEDALDDFAPVIALEDIDTSVSVLFVDASTQELISGTLNVTFYGQNAAQVVDIYSDPLSEVAVENGILTFGISNAIRPSEDQPFRVEIGIDGGSTYLSKRVILTLDQTGDNDFEESLVNLQNPPEGVVILTESVGATDANNALPAPIRIESVLNQSQKSVLDQSLNAQTAASGFVCELPAGTIFLNAEGAPLSGSLQARFNYFSPEFEESVNALTEEYFVDDQGNPVQPAGVLSMQITDSNGNKARGTTSVNSADTLTLQLLVNKNLIVERLQSAGLLDMDLLATPSNTWPEAFREAFLEVISLDGFQEEEVASKSGSGSGVNSPPIRRRRSIDIESTGALSLNLEDGSTDQASLTYQSFNTGSAKSVLGAKNRSGVMQVDESPFFLTAIVVSISVEPTDLNITVNPNGQTGVQRFSLRTTGFAERKSINVSETDRLFFDGLSYPGNYTLDWFNAQGTRVELATGLQLEAGSNQRSVTLTAPPSTFINTTVRVQLQCQNPNERVRVTNIPTARIFFLQQNPPQDMGWRQASNLRFEYDQSTASLIGGSFQLINVIEGLTYDLMLVYDNRIDYAEIEITGQNLSYTQVVESDICR